MDHFGHRLGMAAIGLALAGFGAAMAADFRGITTRHVRSTAKFMTGFLPEMDEDRTERQITFERIMGVGFIIWGLVFVFGALDPRTSWH